MHILKCKKVKLATVVEGDQKAPFSIATTPRCSRRRYSFPWIAPLKPLYVHYGWVLSKKVSSTIFKSLVWRDLGLNTGLPDHWRTLYPLDQWIQFSVITQFNSIWQIDRTQSVATSLGQSELGTDCMKTILRAPLNSINTAVSTWGYFVAYPGHRWGSLTSWQRSSQCIFQTQLIGPNNEGRLLEIHIF